MVAVLFLPMIVVGLLGAYIETIFLPIIVFCLVYILAARKGNSGLITFNIIFHLLAIIDWVALHLLNYNSSKGAFSGLNNILPISLLGILDIVVFIILLVNGSRRKKKEPIKDTVIDETPIVYVDCPYCGFKNSDDNAYCFKCKNKLK